jgi:phospholipid-binding lipoprotein MlaA
MNAKGMRALGCVIVAVLVTALSGCATTANNPRDPIEGFNRAMFGFNEALDNAVIKPVAEGYRAALPPMVRTGVTNFFGNIEDLWIAVNNVLQGKVVDGVQDLLRVAVNTVFGLAGVIDVASDMGMQKHNEDFGQTLGKWGVGDGAYVVWPIFGPSTVRDSGGKLVDMYVDPVLNEDPVYARNTAIVLRTVDNRANLLDATNVLEQAALDKYTFVRDAFLQRRRSLIYDGNPPAEAKAALDADEEPNVTAAPTDVVAPVAALPVVVATTPAVIAPVVAPVVPVAAAETNGNEIAPVVYTVFADGVALKTPNAAPEATPASMVRFADNVILQAK